MSICILNPSRWMHLWPWNSRLLSPSQAHQNWYLFLSYVCSSSLTIRLVFHHWFVPSCHIHRVFDFLPCPSHLSLPCFRIPSALWGISQGGLWSCHRSQPLIKSSNTSWFDQLGRSFAFSSDLTRECWIQQNFISWSFLVQNSSTGELVTRWTTLSL